MFGLTHSRVVSDDVIASPCIRDIIIYGAKSSTPDASRPDSSSPRRISPKSRYRKHYIHRYIIYYTYYILYNIYLPSSITLANTREGKKIDLPKRENVNAAILVLYILYYIIYRVIHRSRKFSKERSYYYYTRVWNS